MFQKVTEPVAVAHDGELVCPDCANDTELAVLHDLPNAQELCAQDGYLSVVLLCDISAGEVCGRCGNEL